MIYIFPTDTCFGLACSITEIKDYEKIYKIKKRDFGKPLAILVENFEWLEKYTTLTKEQVNFLKNYKKPFTILTESSFVKIWLNFVDEETGEEFRNR
jgi:L-threonylcarbamoyladenylate synthase